MSFTILGLGTALPDTPISQLDGLGIARALGGTALREASWLPSVYLHSGITTRYQVVGQAAVNDVLHGTRHSESVFLPSGEAIDHGPTTAERMAIYAKEAPPLAIRAAHSALTRSGVDAPAITQIVTVSCTGFVSPGVDFAIVDALGLSPTVERTHVGFMGCHAAMNGLRVANALATADPNAVVLLVAVELCSIHYYYGTQPDKVVANALFADGAAAIVGRSSPE